MKHAMKHHDEKGHHSPAKSMVARRMRGEHVEKKVHKAMEEFEHGKLHSGSKHGPMVHSKKQALAIGEHEGREHKHKKHHGKKHHEMKHEKKHGKHHMMSKEKREREHEKKEKRHEKE